MILVVLMHCALNIVGQQPESYDVADAYQIYSLPILREELSGFATGKLVIQKNTVSSPSKEPRESVS